MKRLKKILSPNFILAMFATSMSTLAVGFFVFVGFIIYNGCTSCSPPRYGCSNHQGIIGYTNGHYTKPKK